jgi:hypothetical protein
MIGQTDYVAFSALRIVRAVRAGSSLLPRGGPACYSEVAAHPTSSGVFIPQSDGGADLPMEASAAFNATYVFAGNRALLSSTQLAAALYFRPVKLATALVPPRAAATSRVVVRVPDCLLMPNTLSN